tara:strand:+ start:191 stop:625 length:435 start_codon:yes stop_codon:yes gene_type:complete
MSGTSGEGQLQDYSVDQAAGAVVLVLGAVASLLLVIWQSKCHCKMNLCWIFQCERRPPSEEEMKTLKEQITDKKLNAIKKKEDKILDKEDKILDKVESQKSPRLIPEFTEFTSEVEYKNRKLKEQYERQKPKDAEPEPEPEFEP